MQGLFVFKGLYVLWGLSSVYLSVYFFVGGFVIFCIWMSPLLVGWQNSPHKKICSDK